MIKALPNYQKYLHVAIKARGSCVMWLEKWNGTQGHRETKRVDLTKKEKEDNAFISPT